MKTHDEVTRILDELEALYPDAKAELDFTNPFELLIATILSAQCTDVRVNIVTEELFKRLKQPGDIDRLEQGELVETIRSCGLYKTKSKNIRRTCEILRDEHNGEVPADREALESLPGVGRKTANVVLSNAFGVPAIAVDTHVFRVTNRIGLVDEKTVEKTERKLMDILPKDRWSKAHHLFIFHGRRMCKARQPECEVCPLQSLCDDYRERKIAHD